MRRTRVPLLRAGRRIDVRVGLSFQKLEELAAASAVANELHA